MQLLEEETWYMDQETPFFHLPQDVMPTLAASAQINQIDQPVLTTNVTIHALNLLVDVMQTSALTPVTQAA